MKEWTDEEFVDAMIECDRKVGFCTSGKILELFDVSWEAIEPAVDRLNNAGVIEGGDCLCCCIWFTDGQYDTGLNRLVDWDDHAAVAAARERALA